MTVSAFDDARHDAFSQINVTPLVDVMLVLLIIFMITMPVVNQRLTLDFAQCQIGCTRSVSSGPVRLSIKQTGELYWNGIAINRAELGQNLATLARLNNVPPFVIRADPTVKYALVADVLSAAKNADLSRISIETAQH